MVCLMWPAPCKMPGRAGRAGAAGLSWLVLHLLVAEDRLVCVQVWSLARCSCRQGLLYYCPWRHCPWTFDLAEDSGLLSLKSGLLTCSQVTACSQMAWQ